MFGPERTANLGGRGGSCTCAMFHIASINNNWEGGPMGADLAYERACQKHIYDAGGFGAMGYIFEWANTEVFGYIASQYLWRNTGVPGINNDDQTGFLYYAYPRHYGETVGEMVARVMDESSCVNDQMVLEGVQGAQYPSTGAPLHRDYQLLAAIADRSVEMARKAYQAYTGKEPDIWHPAYNPDDFRWDGYDPLANMTFNAERLRLLCVSTRRSQKICETAIAYRKSQRLIAEGASAGEVLECLDKAVEAAKENQRIYCLNYDDDYNWTDGLCSRVVDELELRRRQFVASISSNTKIAQAWTFDQPGDLEGWTRSNGLETPVVEDGAFVARAIGNDPIVEQTKPLALPVNDRCFVEIEITSDHEGRFRFFWATQEDLEKQAKDAYAFTEGRVRNIPLVGGGEMRVYRISPSWNGTLAKLRFDVPPGASVRVDSIRIVELPESREVPPEDLQKPVPETVRKSADKPLFIPWENLSDILPKDRAVTKPGLYLSTEIGFDRRPDFFRVGVVFTVETQEPGGPWRPIFRRGLARRTTGWEHWDIPLSGLQGNIKLRFTTDSYSRAQNRSAPSWKWAIWGQPQLIEVTSDAEETIAVSAIFTSIAERATTSIHVLHNDKPLFDSLINLEGKGPECNYSASVEVKEGDTIDCVCGWGNGDYGADTTALTVLVKSDSGQVWIADQDFSIQQNPNGPWSYGMLKAGDRPDVKTFALFPFGKTEENVGSVSNPGSVVWEDILSDQHPYRRVPHTADVIQLLRTLHVNSLPLFISECGIGSAMDLLRTVRWYEQVGKSDVEDAQLYRSWRDQYLADWRRYRLDEVFARPDDFFQESIARMAGQRLMSVNAVRANPACIGHSITGTLDQGMTAEGIWTTFRELKPGATDAIFDVWAPVRWCLFAGSEMESGTFVLAEWKE
ncbi:MAG: hypothetical protein ACYC4N_13335 [Pirellulaceae bacterium]